MGGGQTMSQIVAIGVGCRKDCSAEAVVALVRRALASAPGAHPLGLFTASDKVLEPGLIQAAHRLGLDLVPLTRDVLKERSGNAATRSVRVEHLFGIPSVAETAALAGAGPSSVLLAPRLTEAGVACAIALAKEAPQ
jgi:cobalt-precorrin 5A hydrolase